MSMAKKVKSNNETTQTNVRANEADYAKLQYALVLNHYILNLLGCDGFEAIAKGLKDPRLEGYDENNVSLFHKELVARLFASQISEEDLLRYDQHIYRHTEAINKKRNEPVRWKYFQYLGLLFTEIYLDRYFSNKEALLADLNFYLSENFSQRSDTYHQIEPFRLGDLNKVAYWNATGSGKTLLMHINILQYIDYARDAGTKFNRILLVTPNEGLTKQHLKELDESNLMAAIFQKSGGALYQGELVELIEVSKLAEKDGDKTVAVESFEDNNLVLIDEGHRGSSGDVWKQMRERLSEKGFSFEYSATFGQSVSSLNGTAKKKMLDEYAKATLMDYSYRYFYNDGYGKDYEILNLNEGWSEHTLTLYLTACLLNFYEQQKLFKQKEEDMKSFLLEKPLAIFVGSSVTAVRTEQKREVSDVVTILKFFSDFIGNPQTSRVNIEQLNRAYTAGTEKITTVQKELSTAQKELNSMKTDIHINEAKEAAAKAGKTVFNAVTSVFNVGEVKRQAKEIETLKKENYNLSFKNQNLEGQLRTNNIEMRRVQETTDRQIKAEASKLKPITNLFPEMENAQENIEELQTMGIQNKDIRQLLIGKEIYYTGNLYDKDKRKSYQVKNVKIDISKSQNGITTIWLNNIHFKNFLKELWNTLQKTLDNGNWLHR